MTCQLRTQINSVAVLNAATGQPVVEFQLEHLEVVDANPNVVCLIVQGNRAGVYYFDSQQVPSQPCHAPRLMRHTQALYISSLIAQNIKDANIRDDGKLAQLMQDDEFLGQLQQNPEFRAALAEGAQINLLPSPSSTLESDARSSAPASSKAQARLGTDSPQPPSIVLGNIKKGRIRRCTMPATTHSLSDGKASLVLKNLMRKFKSNKEPKQSKPHKAPPGYFNNPISETGPDKSHVPRPPGFFAAKPRTTPLDDVVPMIGDDDDQDDQPISYSALHDDDAFLPDVLADPQQQQVQQTHPPSVRDLMRL